MASCGRDRTTQLFRRTPSGGHIEHFQTLEFAARVVKVHITQDKIFTCSLDRTLQVHDLVAKEGQPDIIAAVPSRVISLKASPTCMAMGPSDKTIFVSLLDRSISQYDVATGRLLMTFKCTDESGIESAVLDSLILGQGPNKDYLLSVSNTDKSVRVYDAQTGYFLDREWGHTEAINGIALVEEDDGSRKVVSVGSDSTVMVWSLDAQSLSPSGSRDPSPVKEASSSRQPLRRVLSRAELAEFQRQSPSSAPAGRRSPPRASSGGRRGSSCRVTPTGEPRWQCSRVLLSPLPRGPLRPPCPRALDRRRQAQRRKSPAAPRSPPSAHPRGRRARRTSGPLVPSAWRRRARVRALRAYRKKLSSAEPSGGRCWRSWTRSRRLTASALGDRAVRSKVLDESVFAGLLEQYSGDSGGDAG